MKHVDNADPVVRARKSIYATDKGSRNTSYQRVEETKETGKKLGRQEERLFLVDRVPNKELYTSARGA